MKIKPIENQDEKALEKYVQKIQVEMVQEKMRIEDSRMKFYRVLVKYNIKKAKEFTVVEGEVEEDLERANWHLKMAETAEKNYEKLYNAFLQSAYDELNFYKIERRELRETVSDMQSYLKKFSKKSKLFPVVQKQEEEIEK